MKRFILILISALFILNANAQVQSEKQTDTIPFAYLGVGAGLNYYTGLFGVSVTVKTFDKIFIRGAIGLGSWGNKYSIGIRCDRRHNGGWSYLVGYSRSSGGNGVKTKLELKSGETKEVIIDYLPASTLNLSLSYSWMVAKKNNFFLEFGYAVPLESKPWRVKDGSILSSLSESALAFVQPGGLMLGLGFNFGLK